MQAVSDTRLAEAYGADDAAAPVLQGRWLLAAGAVLVAITAVLATWGRRWSWTGFSDKEELWEWLQLLAQPAAIVFVVVQMVFRPDPRRTARFLAGSFAALAVLIAAGYTLHWEWTGFQEYRLWDWLHLLVLPVMLVLLPVWLRSDAPVQRGVLIALAVVGTVLAGAILGGYALHWNWTGCRGKTVRDWLTLLITPFVLPVAGKCFIASQHARR